MEAVKNGELPQASELFDRYHRRIFNFLRQMTRDSAEAEDLTQNVFLRLIKYRKSYREGHRFQSWIYQLARNVFADHHQATKKMKGSHVDVQDLTEQLADANDGADEREKLLQRAMTALTEEQRELLVLTRFQQMKYEEVAVLLGTTVANVKVRVHRAIEKLRTHYFELENV